jgi:glycerol-3-phosphate dehydrogenase (NAD(P)+)
MRIALLGAGAWGTALAVQAAPRHEVLLWARDAEHARWLDSARENARYLPGIALPLSVHITDALDAALAHARDGLAVVATPMSGLRAMLAAVAARDGAHVAVHEGAQGAAHEAVQERAQARVLWLCKGFEAGTGLLGHEIARALRPQAACGVLSGPSFAEEVARGRPTALVAASDDAALREAAAEAFHSDALRVYTSADPVGVEIGGAVKNVMAIATGIADGMNLGLNARAALITRGLAEMTRLGVALGARAETFMGLSGLGDLVLTATGDLSRNRQVGLRLARGVPLADILAGLGHVAEGVFTAAMVLRRARALGVEMPITEAVAQVLDGVLTPREALEALMARDARAEA